MMDLNSDMYKGEKQSNKSNNERVWADLHGRPALFTISDNLQGRYRKHMVIQIIQALRRDAGSGRSS